MLHILTTIVYIKPIKLAYMPTMEILLLNEMKLMPICILITLAAVSQVFDVRMLWVGDLSGWSTLTLVRSVGWRFSSWSAGSVIITSGSING